MRRKINQQSLLTLKSSCDTIATMKLRDYLKGKSRQDFADKTKSDVHYINNLCQHPELAGKKMIQKIIKATNGKVTFKDF
jgi:hypothetical protein